MSHGAVATTCPQCGAALTGEEAQCPSCTHYLGAPNVRACSFAAEMAALAARAQAAEKEAAQRGCHQVAKEFSETIRAESGVVVALPAMVARQLLSDPRSIYQNYESLVESGTRTAARPDDDRMRRSVGGLLFGSNANEIRYGVLSLDETGPSSYGEVFCRLKDVTIQHRVSFTETNSYTFITQHDLAPGKDIPKGHRAVWPNRDQLALAKLGKQLKKGQKKKDWAKLLLQSAGNRATDDFIEAHIFGGFNADSIQGVTALPLKAMSKTSKLDAKIALELFQKRSSTAVPGKAP
jgi:hypothetical protein